MRLTATICVGQVCVLIRLKDRIGRLPLDRYLSWDRQIVGEQLVFSPRTVAEVNAALSGRYRPRLLATVAADRTTDWFLPCTSFAIVLPMVANRVPGETGRNHCEGTFGRHSARTRTGVQQRLYSVL